MTLEKVRLKLLSSPQFTRKSKAFCFIHPDTHQRVTPEEEREEKLKLIFWMEEGPKIFIRFLEETVLPVFFLSFFFFFSATAKSFSLIRNLTPLPLLYLIMT